MVIVWGADGSVSLCSDARPQGLPCNRCKVDSMIYDDLVDETYMVPKFDEYLDNDNMDEEDKEESECGYDPRLIQCIQGPERTLAITNHTGCTLEEEEKVIWAMCPNCQDIGEEGRVCTNCEDMGMVYNVPMEDKGYNLQNHNDIDTGLEEHNDSEETPSSESNNSAEQAESQELGGTANDWIQVNQIRNEERVFDKWFIDSGASVHMTNQKGDICVPKSTMQPVTIRSRKAMTAAALELKPTKLPRVRRAQDQVGRYVIFTNFKKKIISLLKLLDQGYKVNKWTREYFWLLKGTAKLQVQRRLDTPCTIYRQSLQQREPTWQNVQWTSMRCMTRWHI